MNFISLGKRVLLGVGVFIAALVAQFQATGTIPHTWTGWGLLTVAALTSMFPAGQDPTGLKALVALPLLNGAKAVLQAPANARKAAFTQAVDAAKPAIIAEALAAFQATNLGGLGAEDVTAQDLAMGHAVIADKEAIATKSTGSDSQINDLAQKLAAETNQLAAETQDHNAEKALVNELQEEGQTLAKDVATVEQQVPGTEAAAGSIFPKIASDGSVAS